MNNLVQWVTFLDMVASLQQWSLLWPYFIGLSSGSQILEAIMVMSISRRIFWKGGSFTLKLEVPLKVTTFGRGLLPSLFTILGQLSSIETLTASNVRTLDWNIRKSEVSTFTTIEAIISLTHIMFLSGEYSMKKSISDRGLSNLIGLDSQAIISQLRSRAERQLQNSCLGFSWRSTLKLILLDSFQFLRGLPQLKCGLMVWKNQRKLQLISFSLFLRAQLSLRFFFRSWLYSSSNFQSLFWYSLKSFIRSAEDCIRSRIEQFLMRYSMEYQQNMLVCYRAWKKKGQFDQQKEQLVIFLYCCMKESKWSQSGSFWLGQRFQRTGARLVYMCSRMPPNRVRPSMSFISPSSNLQKTTTTNLFQLPRTIPSSTLISDTSIRGFTAKFLQLNRKQPSSTTSWHSCSKLSFTLDWAQFSMQVSRVRQVAFWALALWEARLRTRVRYSEWASMSWVDWASRTWSVSSISMGKKYKNLRNRELNSGLLRDRQGQQPLYYCGSAGVGAGGRPKWRGWWAGDDNNIMTANKDFYRRRMSSGNLSRSRSKHQHYQRPREDSRDRKYNRKKNDWKSRERKEATTRHRKKRHHSPSPSSASSSSSSSSSGCSSCSSSVSPQTRRRRKTPHFQYRVGEKIGHKYKVTALLGTGTFGRVVEGDFEGRKYAIKIIKPVPKYTDSARTERSIIKKICWNDPFDDYHIVRYIEHFYHRNHYCIVFQRLGLSLYELIKKNKFVGFPHRHVRSFARQLLQAVNYLSLQGYTHTDLKPENVLLCSATLEEADWKGERIFLPASKKIKLIDFGGATHKNDSHSQVINTRQYRSPEVILQCCEWDELSDVWSIGCILIQIVTGELLFHVHDDFDHIYMIDKLCGKFPPWMTHRASRQFQRLFLKDGNLNYEYGDRHVQDHAQILKLRSLQHILEGQQTLLSLIKGCLQIDPKKRMSCMQALRHPYFDRKGH